MMGLMSNAADLAIIAAADWVVDEGAPSAVAQTPASITGQLLKKRL